MEKNPNPTLIMLIASSQRKQWKHNYNGGAVHATEA